MYSPSLSEAKLISQYSKYRVIPICAEIFSDVATSVEVLRKLKTLSHLCFILESVDGGQRWGRYTFLGFDPKVKISCENGIVSVKKEGKINKFKTTKPGNFIQKELNEYFSPKINGFPPFVGGFVGYFSYDYAKYSEPVVQLSPKTKDFNDFDLMLFDKVIVFDNLKKKIVIIVNIHTDDLDNEYVKGVAEIEKIIKIIKYGMPCITAPPKLLSDFQQVFDEKKYCAIVEKAKEYIYAGDIFQVVLSNKLEADFKGSLLDVYRALRTTNPSPYMFYLTCDDGTEIAGSSPETLVKLTDFQLSTFPLAGTRPRGANDDIDVKLENELLSNEKELAEHNMLVDLGRNDLGKISEIGSIKVEKYLSVLKFSHVMHIGSTVSSKIMKNKNAIDVVNAVLPAGTLSGAPKIRAMQIINELEGDSRGVYGGAVGYLDFTGNMDLCIAIRMAYQKNDKLYIRSGAGIVYDSEPKCEYQECLNKAKAIIDAVKYGLNVK